MFSFGTSFFFSFLKMSKRMNVFSTLLHRIQKRYFGYSSILQNEKSFLMNKKKKDIYKQSIFFEEFNDKKNVDNSANLLRIVKNSNIENLNPCDCTLILNYLIKNKKNKNLPTELKNANTIKVGSSLYKEVMVKVLKNILTYDPKHIYFFLNKFVELRDSMSFETLCRVILINHLNCFSLYYLVDINYYMMVLNCSFANDQSLVKQFEEFLITNIIKENKSVHKYQQKIENRIKKQEVSERKAIYIKSGSTEKILFRKNMNNTSGYDVKEDRADKFVEKKGCRKEISKFSIDSLSNVMLYKLLYSLVKINCNKELVKELFILLIPYVRYLIQNKNYIYSEDRTDLIIKIIWSYAYLHIRDVNLFYDFSLCIYRILDELSMEYLRIVKNVYERLLIFDELLLDKLEHRINEIEKYQDDSFSQPRRRQFKKKKKRIEITDPIRFKLKK